MVVPDERQDVLQAAEMPDDLGTVLGVALDQLELVLGQRPGLRQDRVWHAQLADVVEEPGETERLDQRPSEAELLADCEHDRLHAPRVASRGRVLCVDRRVEALDHLEGRSARAAGTSRGGAWNGRAAAICGCPMRHARGARARAQSAEHGCDREPEHVDTRADQTLQRRGVRIDLECADRSSVARVLERRVHLDELVEPAGGLGGILAALARPDDARHRSVRASPRMVCVSDDASNTAPATRIAAEATTNSRRR
jgi:hypothetical protein